MKSSKPNSLIHSSSPYLQQHAHNPVNWQEWNKLALNEAQELNKPIIVSIGYSACHWCHVMEHESFENETLAKLMNDNFVCIKVDREERPDIDQIYMDAIQNMGLRGGWPLNVFCMPDGSPFYGGTYFPAQQWGNLLAQVSNAYKNHFDDIQKSALGFKESLNVSDFKKFGMNVENAISETHLKQSFEKLKTNFDTQLGGMNRAPKFPMPCNYRFLLDYSCYTKNIEAQNQLHLTLTKMALGGIYDQLGGGFARYSVDAEWFAPHFEKMLYDNAQLVSLYALAYQFAPNPLYKKVVYETISFVINELRSPNGGFYSALDADSEGEEGKYYVWQYDEIQSVLGDKSNLFCEYFNVTKNGNWEHGNNILHSNSFIDNNDINESIKKLFAVRQKRIRPGLDNKIITSWHAMMVNGLVDAYKVFDEKLFLEEAILNAHFIVEKLTFLRENKTGLFRLYKEKNNHILAFLDDYAFVIQAFINLYEVTFEIAWLNKAKGYLDFVFTYFEDENDPFLFYSDSRSEKLIARKKEIFDNVIPSSNAVMATNLFKLGHFYTDHSYLEKSKNMIDAVQKLVISDLGYTSQWANLALLNINPFYEIVHSGQNAQMFFTKINSKYIPNKILASVDSQISLPIFQNRINNTDNDLFYVCENNTCQLPEKEIDKVIYKIVI